MGHISFRPIDNDGIKVSFDFGLFKTLSMQYESEVNAKSEMQKALSKSNTELNEWRQKYEEEAVVKNGQLEETNKGLVSELNTLGDEMLAAKSKVSLPRDLGTIRSTWNI